MESCVGIPTSCVIGLIIFFFIGFVGTFFGERSFEKSSLRVLFILFIIVIVFFTIKGTQACVGG